MDDRTLGHLYAIRQQLDRITAELVDIEDATGPKDSFKVEGARKLIDTASDTLLGLDPGAGS